MFGLTRLSKEEIEERGIKARLEEVNLLLQAEMKARLDSLERSRVLLKEREALENQ
ncbi:MAG: hypothetical protein Unbinned96contig1001_27 [Prokaryotic dsDNA virus sp.]|mgnify:CR=1 FL=1|nr:MAG: hypothetical protein Unbinned96contig1001_27 [Prokaryotic dsDNA virus sp.]|tara:strand:- start:15222 stop:15389 length:168 start_codon:yes stop_codon:yes gene_type:complete